MTSSLNTYPSITYGSGTFQYGNLPSSTEYKQPVQTDPIIPGEMYRANIAGYTFTYLRRGMTTIADQWGYVTLDSASHMNVTGGMYPSIQNRVGNINHGDVVFLIGEYTRADSLKFYKLINKDEMGYVPTGDLILEHVTEDNCEQQA